MNTENAPGANHLHRLQISPRALMLILLTAFLIMLPRLLNPSFNLLDDGVTLLNAHAMTKYVSGTLTQGSAIGRFFPGYLIINFLIFTIAGDSAFAFFIANYLALAGIATGLYCFAGALGANRIQALIAALLLLFVGPIIESFYTISRQEPFYLLFIVASLIIASRYSNSFSRSKRISVFLSTLITISFAYFTKEPAIAMVPISLGWLILGRFTIDQSDPPQFSLSSRKMYFLANIIACGCYWAVRVQFVPLKSVGGYLLGWTTLFSAISYYGALFSRDFAYLLPLVVFLIFLRPRVQKAILVDASLWMLGWLAVFVPWPIRVEYYLLPFTLGPALMGGVIAEQIISSIQKPAKLAERSISTALLGTAALLFIMCVANNVTNARVQISVDSANSEMLQGLSKLPPNSKIMINLSESNEYLYEIGIHIKLFYHRTDLHVEAYKEDPALLAGMPGPCYLATPFIANRITPSVRVPVEDGDRPLLLRRISSFIGHRPKEIVTVIRQFHYIDFGIHRIFCLLLNAFPNFHICGALRDVPRAFIDCREFSYGWRVFEVIGDVKASQRDGAVRGER